MLLLLLGGDCHVEDLRQIRGNSGLRKQKGNDNEGRLRGIKAICDCLATKLNYKS